MTNSSLLALLILIVGCAPLVEKFKPKPPVVVSLEVIHQPHPAKPGHLIAIKTKVSRNCDAASIQITQKISGEWYDEGALSKIYDLTDTELEKEHNVIVVMDVIYSTRPGTFRVDVMAMRGNRWDKRSKTITIQQFDLKTS